MATISFMRGPAWRGSKVPPTKNGKLLEFGPLFFGSGQLVFYFLAFTIKFYFIFPQEGAWPLCPSLLPRSPGPVNHISAYGYQSSTVGFLQRTSSPI